MYNNRKQIGLMSKRQKRRIKKKILTGIHYSFASLNNNEIQQNDTAVLSEGYASNDALNNPSSNISLNPSLPSFDDDISNPYDNPANLPLEVESLDNDSLSDTSLQCSCLSCLQPDHLDLIDDLRDWAINCNIPLSHTSKLLQILNKHKLRVPCDARTLLNTPRTVDVTEVHPGQYSHIGLRAGIVKDLNILPKNIRIPSEIKLNVNVDGLPLSKSSGSQFWPVLAWIDENTFKNHTFRPFVVGIYHGKKKPTSSNHLLEPFVNEFLELQETGIMYEDVRINLKINAIVCDAPAKAFITCVKSHTGYHGCGKCIQEGDFLNNRMTFPEIGSQIRTDESFQKKTFEDHHIGVSILENLNIGMVTQIPNDYMHLVCLGVMKRLLQFWHKGRQDVRVPCQIFETSCDTIISFKDFITNDFCRKPRRISESDRFKATEFRQVLLYTGVVAFKDMLPENMYHHFLLFSCAIRILTSPNLCITLNQCAQNLLETFIELYGNIYGHQYITYNVHNLSHLCNDVMRFGNLDNFSAFPPENYMYHLKKKICLKSGKPLQQIVKRLSEEKRSYKCNSVSENLKKGKKRTEVQVNNFVLTDQQPDNCCLLKNGQYLTISEIFEKSNEIFVKGKYLESKGNFFSDPIDSRKLGIHLTSVNNILIECSLKEILCKVMLLPYGDNFVVLPLIHNCENL